MSISDLSKRLLCMLILTAVPLTAQDDIYVQLEKPGITRYKMGIKPSDKPFPGSVSWMHTLTRDLILSESFDLATPAGEEPKDPMKRFEHWQKSGADFLLTTTVEVEDQAITLLHHVYDIKTRKIILSKQYRGERVSLTAMAHALADEIILYFTGRRGVSQTKIAFVSDRSGHKEIFICDADGSGQQPLTAHRDICLSPAWSNDGSRIAFTSYALGKPSLFMLVWRDAKLIKIPTGLDLNSSPTFSPDGEHLLFAASSKGNVDVYGMDLNTGEIDRLTHARAIDTNPAFSPNGQEILFTSDRTGVPQLYLMDREGVNVRILTRDGDYNDEGIWSPAGNLIAYTSREEYRFQIKVIDILSGLTSVLTTTGNNEASSFSPDGKRLVFTSDRSGSSQVYTMNVDGTRMLQLTTEGNNFSPTWSPYMRNTDDE